jgi:Type II CAAX prenyl endopeptidase Rce1-like
LLTKRPLAAFAWAMLVFYVVLWGAELVFPRTAASAVVMVGATLAALFIVRPGWNIRAGGSAGYSIVVFGLVLASAAAGTGFLRWFEIPLPYDLSSLDIGRALPGIAAIVALEELVFRQIAFRWLERRDVPQKKIVLATAVAYGLGHSGALLTVAAELRPFYLLSSVYLVWIGMLLGELRRASGSWALSWLGHLGHNVVVLVVLSIGRQP